MLWIIQQAPAARRACPVCGASAADIHQSGRVGCAECYNFFSDALTPAVIQAHGDTAHTGKRPRGAVFTRHQRSAELERELERAIERQDFERCAVLRDEIRAIAGEGGGAV